MAMVPTGSFMGYGDLEQRLIFDKFLDGQYSDLSYPPPIPNNINHLYDTYEEFVEAVKKENRPG